MNDDQKTSGPPGGPGFIGKLVERLSASKRVRLRFELDGSLELTVNPPGEADAAEDGPTPCPPSPHKVGDTIELWTDMRGTRALVLTKCGRVCIAHPTIGLIWASSRPGPGIGPGADGWPVRILALGGVDGDPMESPLVAGLIAEVERLAGAAATLKAIAVQLDLMGTEADNVERIDPKLFADRVFELKAGGNPRALAALEEWNTRQRKMIEDRDARIAELKGEHEAVMSLLGAAADEIAGDVRSEWSDADLVDWPFKPIWSYSVLELGKRDENRSRLVGQLRVLTADAAARSKLLLALEERERLRVEQIEAAKVFLLQPGDATDTPLLALAGAAEQRLRVAQADHAAIERLRRELSVHESATPDQIAEAALRPDNRERLSYLLKMHNQMVARMDEIRAALGLLGSAMHQDILARIERLRGVGPA